MMEEIGEQSKKSGILVAVISIVRKDGKILLLRKAKPPYTGLLSLPGGKVEFAEHPVAAAIREVKEETDLDCKFVKMFGVMSEVLHDAKKEKQHFLMFVAELAADSFETKPSDEGELTWIDENQWDRIKRDAAPSDWRIVKDFLFEKNSKMELREVKMCAKEQNGEICYEMEEFISP
ncbi:MAG: NUDIX hydrolase [Candidatus Micrarchaeota archaeon]|nr:NUDIX hydrolase [Candidatus Micrarchaeota archaeon]